MALREIDLRTYLAARNGVLVTKQGTDAKTKGAKAPARGGRSAVRLVDDVDTGGPAASEIVTTRQGKVRRGDEVRERILKAALECFGAFGFEGTSTRAVAERAEVTHTLVLYHFQSKDQLWIATMDAALTQYAEAIKHNLEASAGRTARDTLATFIDQFVRMSARQPQIHRILTAEGNQQTHRLEWIVENFIRWHFTLVRDLIRRGQAEGTVRECDPARLYYLIIGAGGTLFTLSTEYKAMTNRDVFSEVEILRNIAFIYEIVFT
ncbi:TetR/AcrR family transcriptional regulator [Sphingomonas sp. ID0503]|uniref:TetR/AcrR family transcriptional regulator n=1 Tax=Sphingomonas sp. ID0503 TaxID=3399691 RepID=UPI003AFA4A57